MKTWRPKLKVFLPPAPRGEDNRKGASLQLLGSDNKVWGFSFWWGYLHHLRFCQHVVSVDHFWGYLWCWGPVHKVSSAQVGAENCHTLAFLHRNLIFAHSPASSRYCDFANNVKQGKRKKDPYQQQNWVFFPQLFSVIFLLFYYRDLIRWLGRWA